MRRLLLLLDVGLALLVLQAITPAVARSASGTLTLTPGSGAPSVAVSVIGVGFPPTWHFALRWDTVGRASVAQVTADAGGSFTTVIVAPAADGAHLLLALEDIGSIAATASYNVAAATATPAPTVTSIPTQTPFPTATPVPTATAIPQGINPNNPAQYCTGLFGWCPDLSGLWNAVTSAIFGTITDWIGGVWNAVTSPFAAVLTSTPNMATDAAWHDVTVLESTLQPLAGSMFVCFLVLGMFARYLAAIGKGDFTAMTAPLMRAIIITGFIAGYTPIMSTVFQLLQGFAGVISSAPVLGTGSGFSAIGSAFATLSNVFSITTLIDLLIVIVGLIVALIAVVIRELGLGIQALCYATGPLAAICWLSPQFEFIARWWFRTLINVSLWPIGFALVLKLTGALLADSGWSGLTQSLAALGCVFLLYRIPGIIGSMCGSKDAGGAVTAMVGTVIANTISTAQRAFGK